MFGFIWFNGFSGEDIYVKVYNIQQMTDAE